MYVFAVSYKPLPNLRSGDTFIFLNLIFENPENHPKLSEVKPLTHTAT